MAVTDAIRKSESGLNGKAIKAPGFRIATSGKARPRKGMRPMKSILVTGDVVCDCHLYGGVKTEAASFSEPGTIYAERLGAQP